MNWRPRNLDEVVGQDKVVQVLRSLKKPTNLLFSGPPGVGKTTTAYAFCNERGIPVVELNASDERGIETIRTRVKELAFSTGQRCILLDEADHMTSDAQHALRRIMERATSAFFILTCNEEYRIIDPIKSRCLILRFKKLTERDVLKVLVKLHGKPKSEEEKERLLLIAKKCDGDLRTALKWYESITDVSLLQSMEQQPLPPSAVEKAWQGDLEGAIMELEKMYAQDRLDVRETIRKLYEQIRKIPAKRYQKAKLYIRLADVEAHLRLGCTPLIQLASFLADVYAVRQLPGAEVIQ